MIFAVPLFSLILLLPTFLVMGFSGARTAAFFHQCAHHSAAYSSAQFGGSRPAIANNVTSSKLSLML